MQNREVNQPRVTPCQTDIDENTEIKNWKANIYSSTLGSELVGGLDRAAGPVGHRHLKHN